MSKFWEKFTKDELDRILNDKEVIKGYALRNGFKGQVVAPVNVGHKWQACHMCGPMVVCGACGNNTCNGGHGELDGKECQYCYTAHEKAQEEYPGPLVWQHRWFVFKHYWFLWVTLPLDNLSWHAYRNPKIKLKYWLKLRSMR